MKNQRFAIITIGIIILGGLLCVVRSSDMIGHYFYAPIEAPFCLSKIGKRIGVAPNYPAVDEYIRKNLHRDMDKIGVRRVFERISPVSIDEYDNIDGAHFADIVILMCEEPLNNLVYTVAYSADGKFVSIEPEEFP